MLRMQASGCKARPYTSFDVLTTLTDVFQDIQRHGVDPVPEFGALKFGSTYSSCRIRKDHRMQYRRSYIHQQIVPGALKSKAVKAILVKFGLLWLICRISYYQFRH